MCKTFFSLVFSCFWATAMAQQASPLGIISISCFGGSRVEFIQPAYNVDVDGGIIMRITTDSPPGTGNVDWNCLSSNMSPGWYGSVFRKYDADGNTLLWERCFYSDTSMYAGYFPLAGGGAILAGHNDGNADHRAFVARTDAAGNVIWKKHYGGNGGEEVVDVIAASDGGYILLAETRSYDGDVGHNYGLDDLWILKVDSAGDKLWSVVVGGSYSEHGMRLVAMADGGCYAVGLSWSNDFDAAGQHGAQDILVARIDGSGNKKWTKSLGGSGNEGNVAAACSNGSGGLWVAVPSRSYDGDVSSPVPGRLQTWLAELDGDGNILRSRCHGDICEAFPMAISAAEDGTIWIGGGSTEMGIYAEGKYGGTDNWIMHLDPGLDLINTLVMGTNGEDYLSFVHALPGGRVLAGGNTGGPKPSSHLPANFQGNAFIAIVNQWALTIPEEAAPECTHLYPNPASSVVTVRADDSKHRQIRITDISGRTMFATAASAALQVDVSHWPHGMYYVTQVGDDGDRYTEKLVVE